MYVKKLGLRFGVCSGLVKKCKVHLKYFYVVCTYYNICVYQVHLFYNVYNLL
jgi:hypothetical protein